MLESMGRVRRRLSWIVGLWLVCQVSVLAAAPLSLAGIFVNAGVEGVLCTCASASGPDHYCPMHGKHQDHASSAQDADDCVLRSGSPASDVTLVSLISGIGLMPPAQAAATTAVAAEPIAALPEAVLSRSDRPEAPPPRPSLRSVDIS